MFKKGLHYSVIDVHRGKLNKNDVCDSCDLKHRIEHLLFECHRAARLWHIVKDAYQITVCLNNIICELEDYDLVFNHVATLLAFLLYEEWLLMSLENLNRCVDFQYHFYINDLKLHDKICCTKGMFLNLYPII